MARNTLGTIHRHIFVSAQTRHVAAGIFRVPATVHMEGMQHGSRHDLPRVAVCLSRAGRTGIFNRSYYEEGLIVRVHPENPLHHNGTRIIKFFPNLPEEEQRKRFLDRIDEPKKNWKFRQADIEERKFWKQHMQAYEAYLSATSTKFAPPLVCGTPPTARRTPA